MRLATAGDVVMPGLANSHYLPSTALYIWYLTYIFALFTSSNKCDSNLYNFVANGAGLTGQNIFERRTSFEPSKVDRFGKGQETRNRKYLISASYSDNVVGIVPARTI